MLGWHPREDFIFMFANLPPYLPKVVINTLLCLPEKYLKEQFVQVLYGLTWQYSWLMTAAKFGGRPREFPNLICLGVLHLSIIPARLYLCGFWTTLLSASAFGLFGESHILQGDLPKKSYNLIPLNMQDRYFGRVYHHSFPYFEFFSFVAAQQPCGLVWLIPLLVLRRETCVLHLLVQPQMPLHNIH